MQITPTAEAERRAYVCVRVCEPRACVCVRASTCVHTFYIIASYMESAFHFHTLSCVMFTVFAFVVCLTPANWISPRAQYSMSCNIYNKSDFRLLAEDARGGMSNACTDFLCVCVPRATRNETDYHVNSCINISIGRCPDVAHYVALSIQLRSTLRSQGLLMIPA